MALNKGKNQVGQVGSLNQISYGDQSPADDAVPLSWNVGDFRYYIGSNTFTLGWRCVTAGTPGTWRQVSSGGFDLFLSYGNQSGDGALPTPPEATPSFYLRPNTDKTVQMSFSGSPGAIWEYEVGGGFSGIEILDVFVYSCGLTPAGVGPASLTLSATINDAATVTTVNLDGLTNTRISPTAIIGAPSGNRVGIKCITTNVGTGFLMCTAHLAIR